MLSPDSSLEDRPRLVVLVGPTAVGKTALAIQLAERLGGEIVSADSRLFYIGMDIGTAKPSPAEQRRVRHHLIDVTMPDQTWSLAVFQQAAHQAILDITRRGKLPLLVGGTGQYLRAVIQGWRAPGVKPNPALRLALNHLAAEIGAQALHQKLASLDPQAAQVIDARNLRRTMRALEVIFSSGRRFSEQRQQGNSPYQLLLVGLHLPRPELYARIDTRIQSMLDAGLVDEVRGLLVQGYSPELPALSAIGYREIISYLQGRISLEDAVQLIQRQTRIFVRRQGNWFKLEDPSIHWYLAGPGVVEEIENLIRQWSAGWKNPIPTI